MNRSKNFKPWSSQQAFFAVNGGIAVNTSSFWKYPRLTFTSEGIVLLAEMGLLPAISEPEIEARSKADGIAKLIVCFQASWFVVQCGARLVAGLPITLIEVHTLAHIVCALMMYIIWFEKPYGVNAPIVLDDPRVVNLAALLALRPDEALWGHFQENFSSGYDEWRLYREGELSLNNDDHEMPSRFALSATKPEYMNEPVENCSLSHCSSQRALITINDVRSVNNAPVESNKIFTHLEAANNALAYFRRQAIHFRWQDTSRLSATGGLLADEVYRQLRERWRFTAEKINTGNIQYYPRHTFLRYEHSNCKHPSCLTTCSQIRTSLDS